MSEFLRYVLWELRRYSALAMIAVFFTAMLCWLARYFYRRKYGAEKKFPWRKLILPLLFLGYLALVFFVTNFRASRIHREVNLHLFRAWKEALNNFSQHRWLNVLLNIAMFCPIGFLLPILNQKFRKWYWTIPAGFGYSLLIEILQLIFARGVFDVDDLFCNTLGTMIGYFAVMMFVSLFHEKGRRWKLLLVYSCLTLFSLGAVGSVFLCYHMQEFGNLPQGAAYRVNTGDAVWTLACELPAGDGTAAVYRTQTRITADCDAFAENFKQIIPTEFEDISYYQEAAYYMDHGNGDGSHFLFVHYLDQGYEYTAIYEDEPVWTEGDREQVEKALEKYSLRIPAEAEFAVLGDGWHSFTVKQLLEGATLFDGQVRIRMAEDGSIREIENGLLSYTYYRDAALISPEEAFARLTAGRFNDEGIFERVKPAEVRILSCDLEYRVDTKGFYQPVYAFGVESVDGSYRYQIVIPAIA